MELYSEIRRAARVEGLSVNALAKRFRVHRRTIRQALASPVPPERKTPERRAPKLELFKPVIDGWLWENLADTPTQRAVRTITIRRAQAEGWLPALAWDDIDLDDAPADVDSETEIVDEVAVELALRGERVQLTTYERQVVIDRASETGVYTSAIAPLLGITPRHVARLRTHAEAA